MVFTSAIFIFAFLPISILIYYAFTALEKVSGFTKKIRIKDIIFILMNLAFYIYADFFNSYWLLGWLIGLILLTFAIASLVKKKCKKSRLILGIGIIILFASLIYCKYFEFLGGLFNRAVGTEMLTFENIIVPAGISFITFSAVSCVVDVYRNNGDDNSVNFIDVALYLTFFPKIISGPIVLWKDFKPQLEKRNVNSTLLLNGINKIITGFAKKVILADTFGLLVSNIQTNTASGIDTLTAWGCAFAYMLQIYYDFAGYSSIAIGVSNLFGFEFDNNFDFPYLSTSITEFWRRWHISLGRWFKEYLYIPLGGNRKGKIRTLVNLGVVFVATGVWHGAGFGYLAWGLWHGIFMIFERLTKDTKFYKKIPKIIKWLVTMFVVMLGWEVFRFGSLSKTIDFIKIMFGVTKYDSMFATFKYYFTPKILMFMVIAVIGATLLGSKSAKKIYEKYKSSKVLFIVGEVLLLLLFVLAIIFMINSTYSPFIYFQY